MRMPSAAVVIGALRVNLKLSISIALNKIFFFFFFL